MINLGKIVVKKEKKVKTPRIMSQTVTARDAFCAKSAAEAIRTTFRAIPSPQIMLFPTPKGEIVVTREKNKGFAAQWFVASDVVDKLYSGTKEAVRQEVGDRIAMAHR